MTLDDLPIDAQATIRKVAAEFGLEPEALLKPRPRNPTLQAARTDAICRLDRARVRGRPRYALDDLAAWFGASRNNIYAQRAKDPGFAPRLRRDSALTV